MARHNGLDTPRETRRTLRAKGKAVTFGLLSRGHRSPRYGDQGAPVHHPDDGPGESHEHLDGHGLIHMNGRMYEPALGRFVNADPLVQAPRDAQSGNRYRHAIEMLRFTPAARSATRPRPGPASAR